MPTLHRYATWQAIKNNRRTQRTHKLNENLTKILGTDKWKQIMWRGIPAKEKEEKIMKLYSNQLRKYLPFVGYCPVREKFGKRTKYYIVFCSRHKDALLLMNDIMHDSYFKTMAESSFKGTLFENKAIELAKPKKNIKEEILNLVVKYPGIEKEECWLEMVLNNFMVWKKSDFTKNLNALILKNKIKAKKDKNHKTKEIFLYPSSYKENIRIHWRHYQDLKNQISLYIQKINDGSIIKRFDKTPFPERPTDVVCPHFLELKWAYGCYFDCAWCYLKGTFRFRPEGITPAFKDYEKIKKHVEVFLNNVKTPELLNTGEIADSLMGEHLNPPFSKFIIEMFEKQNIHKVLFVTKSANIKNILKLQSAKQAIFSFSVNAMPVAQKWEKKTPSPLKRIEAAKKLYEKGLTVRIRIDPMVPIEDWEKYYKELIDIIFSNFIPERITLGSLRGLQSTINGVTDKSWIKYLKEWSNWGRKIDFETRYKMYFTLIKYLENKYGYKNVALCKETIEMWNKLEMDWKNIKCNCLL